MTLQELRDRDLILYECIAGSKAYGLDLPTSDTDIRGVFLMPKERFYGLNQIEQVSDQTNDQIYYELGRFFELLLKNNPNILELLSMPPDKILYKHPLMERIDLALFISKKCKHTFGGYAFAQIKKARGLNKKIVNPVDKVKKSILAFCYVLHEKGSIPLQKWLQQKGWQQECMGLVNVPHAKDMYAMYYDADKQLGYKGILKKQVATSVLLSSIPKSETIVGYLYFNQDGYIKYCKDYREYWDWVDKRNESRYENNVQHGKNYDSKNMMHTFRLLDMATEILTTGKINVKRPNRAELLAIRRGEGDYDELVAAAEQKIAQLDVLYETTTLPKRPNHKAANQLLIELRTTFYDKDKPN